jgi:hypothetical protein
VFPSVQGSEFGAWSSELEFNAGLKAPRSCGKRVKSAARGFAFAGSPGRHLCPPAKSVADPGRRLRILFRGLEALQQVEATFQDKRFLLRGRLSGEASAALRAAG